MFDRQIDNSVCDKALCELSKGNIHALSVIYDRLGRLILSVAFSILGNPADAEDVLQDTLCDIVSGASGYQKGTNARAWVLAVARNIALTKAKQKTRFEDLSDEIPSGDDFSASDDRMLLEQALNRLAPDDRQIVCMKLEAGLTHKEIALITGLSRACVEKRYSRAVSELRTYLSGGKSNEKERNKKTS